MCIRDSPYRALKYGHSVYTIWMGGFNGSIYASLFYLLVPLLAAIPMADTWLSDRQSGYYQFVQTRNKTKQYFRGLYVCNFTAGGLVTIFPLAINLYACFLLVPDEKPDLILWDTPVSYTHLWIIRVTKASFHPKNWNCIICYYAKFFIRSAER